jgi:hypothetical protein
VQDQRAPAAADVEQPLALSEAELAADDVELALLSLIERVVRGDEVRARVDHASTEHEAVEAIRDVVVVADGGAVALS